MKIITTTLLVFYSSIIFSQIQLKGTVVDSVGMPVSSVNVRLAEIIDTSKIADLASTDKSGAFVLHCNDSGKYILTFSHISYRKKELILDVVRDTSIKVILYPSSVKLKEISIKSQSTFFNDDKEVHIITKKDIQKSINSLYLLEVFPQIEIDPVNQNITTKDSKNIKILINGISANQYQIQAINKDDILKIEYYNIAPSRYRGYDSAINVITKNEFRGISFSVFASKSVNKGYGYGNTSLIFSRKNSSLGIYYNNNLGDYKNLIINEKLSYYFDSISYHKEKSGVGSPNNFGHHNFTLKYIFHKKDNLDVVFKIIPNFYNSFSERKQNTSIFVNNILTESGFQKRQENKSKKFNTVNFYIDKHLPKSQEVIFDLSYNYYDYDYSLNTYESKEDSGIIFQDIYKTKNIKNSVISELFYSKTFKKIRFNADFVHSYSKVKQTVNSIISFPSMQNTKGYIEVEMKYHKLYIKSNTGLAYYKYKTNKLKLYSDKISLLHKTSVNYKLSTNNSISFRYNLQSNTPSLSQLNNSKYQLEEFLYRQGNPALKPYLSHHFAINHYFHSKKFSLYSTLKYVFVPDKISEYYYKNSNGVIKSYSNMDWEKYSALSFNLNYYPFSDKRLKFGLYLKTDYSKILFNGKINTGSSLYLQSLLQIYYKKVLFQYVFYSTRKYLGDNINYILPWHSYIVLGYKFKNIYISVDGYYPFSKAWRSIYETIPQSLVHSRREAIFYDNGNMFSIRINYIFAKGKVIKSPKKKLKNTDNDTGVLEEKQK